MTAKGLNLAWIVVKDIKKAIKFYTEVVGLKLDNYDENFKWAELSGHEKGGAVLGVAEQSDKEAIQAGQNAVITVTVADVKKAKAQLSKKNVTMVGDILEIPGHVRLQMVRDQDGNHVQLVEKLGM